MPRKERDYAAEYRRRIEQGKAKWWSTARARGHGTKPMGVRETIAKIPHLSEERQEIYKNVLRSLNDMRNRGLSLSQAVKENHTTPDAFRRYAGTAITKDSAGHYSAKANDHLYRSMRYATEVGTVIIPVANYNEARKLGEYWNGVKKYIDTGDDSGLQKFKGKYIRTSHKTRLPLITDTDILDRLARAGDLDFTDIYELTT